MVESADSIPSFEAVRRQARRLQTFVNTFAPEDLERLTPCQGWQVRDLLAHNASGAETIAGYLEAVIAGRPTQGYDLSQQTALNQAGVAKYRNDPHLVKVFHNHVERALIRLDEIQTLGLADQPFHFFAEITPAQLAGTLTADLAVHSWDYGRAVGRPQRPDPSILEGALPRLIEEIMPKIFRPDKAARLVCTYGFRLTDIPNGDWLFDVDRGRLAVRREPIDGARVRTITDAGTFLLVSYGRLSPLFEILSRRVRTLGNPILGLKFGSLFQKV